MQHNLFGEPESIVLNDFDGELEYFSNFFNESYFFQLEESLPWTQDEITLYGKTHNVPRLQCFMGDSGLNYSYSGIKLETRSWDKLVNSIKNEIEQGLGLEFNCCLCNLYRDGKDYAAWHSDDEAELGKDPVIASVSFGAERKIVFKHKTNKGIEKIEKVLEDRSVLIMKGSLQHHWKHQLNKTAKKVDGRINLTFRFIHPR